MNNIKEIDIQNFKAFPTNEELVLNNKNLLLFGENGSGKSSIYWALYTFLQSSEKDDKGVDKYFELYDPSREETFQSLLNVYSNQKSLIKLTFEDNTTIELSKGNGTNTRIKQIIEANLASDFITYKLLYNFYGSTHKNNLDIWNVFKRDVFPFFSYDGRNLDSHISDFYINEAKDPTTGYYYRRDTFLYTRYQNKIANFNTEVESLLGKISNQANSFLKDYLDISNIEVLLSYSQKFAWDTGKSRNFTKPKIKFHIKMLVDGAFKELHRPQSFLNEAKLSQLSFAIRMGALFTRLAQSNTKVLVLDDLLISLDMDNRNKIMDILLQPTTLSGISNRFKDFQILFFTHDRGLHYFVKEKIKQHNQFDNWIFKEIYAGEYEDKTIGKKYPKPTLIDDDSSDLERAKKYLKTNKDYTASALYIRKALERIISDRLPKELVYTLRGEQRGLNMLWTEFLKIYTIPKDRQELLNQSRLMILNPQAHYNFLSLPVYYEELNKAIKLVEYIDNTITLVNPIILLSKGMQLEFKHPTENYTFRFELLGDFYLGKLSDSTTLTYPKCKVLHFQYKGTNFWNFKTNAPCSLQEKTELQNREDKMNKVIENLTKIPLLKINKKMIEENISINNGLWSFKEVLDKAGVKIL